jgi:hypothetical protein
MEDVGTYIYRNLVYSTVIWYILWKIGIFYGTVVYFFRVLVLCPRKIWQPCHSGMFFYFDSSTFFASRQTGRSISVFVNRRDKKSWTILTFALNQQSVCENDYVEKKQVKNCF